MIVSDQSGLDALCARLRPAPFLCVDTEFVRERTYYPVLCLVQVCGPDGVAAAIDPIAAPDLDWTPFFDLMSDPGILKVFHSSRQDLEIFYHKMGRVPAPLFDTQIAAMVCGMGDSVGYESIVRTVTGQQIDKGPQFTDWAHRPLTDRQVSYALADVEHLVKVYEYLSADITRRGRASWTQEEDAVLCNPRTYDPTPEALWKRIRIRTDKPAVLAILRELAVWREDEARRRDIPRGHVLKDETLGEIALNAPKTIKDLERVRGLSPDRARGRMGEQIMDCIARARTMPPAQWPSPPERSTFPAHLGPVLEMLKMLLRIRCSEHGVVPRLVATQEDMEALIIDQDTRLLHGWRHEVFGADALRLRRGEIGFSLSGNTVRQIEIPQAERLQDS
ncbi:MAG: ribonuclease D [Rhodospirillales bacterium]|nr:ribonuclease D [Rhodospirillales bacterium]